MCPSSTTLRTIQYIENYILPLQLPQGSSIMPVEALTGLPVELLVYIIRLLDPLSILHCRQVHSRCKSSVDSLPEYKVYQKSFKAVMEQYKSTKGAKSRQWSMQSAAHYFDLVRAGVEVDYHLFVQLFLNYPKAMSYVSVMKK